MVTIDISDNNSKLWRGSPHNFEELYDFLLDRLDDISKGNKIVKLEGKNHVVASHMIIKALKDVLKKKVIYNKGGGFVMTF